MNHHTQGQALAELAIFGSIMLMVLASVVRFGLQYMYAQEKSHKAFRTALSEAHRVRPSRAGGMTSPSGTVEIVDDRYIPDPSRPFGIGERTPIIGVGAATWSDDGIVKSPTLDNELPEVKMIVNGQSVTLRQAGYLAWVTPLAGGSGSGVSFQRLAHIFCDPHASTNDQYEECAKSLRRARRNITNGTITLPHGAGADQVIPVVGFSGSGRKSVSIVLDKCAGHLFDPESCKIQCDKLDGVEHRRFTATRTDGIWLSKHRLPLPDYCNKLYDYPTGDRTRRKLNPAMIANPPGLELRSSSRSVVSSNKITAASSSQQVLGFDRSETLGDRVLRYQIPAGTAGGSFIDKTASFPLPEDSAGNAVLDNDKTHEKTFSDKRQQVWTTP